jgi:hypothetical protein
MKELISLNGDGNKVRFMRGWDGDIVIAFDIPGKNLFNESVRIGIVNGGGQDVPSPIKKELIHLCELMERWENTEKAMEELDELIQRVEERGTWKGVDVDEYMKMVRGL